MSETKEESIDHRPPSRIIVVALTNHSKIAEEVPTHAEITGRHRITGVFLPSLCHVLYELSDRGFSNFEFVSCKGGPVAIDHSLELFGSNSYVQRFMHDMRLRENLINTASPSHLLKKLEGSGQAENVAGIFVPGGHGNLFDMWHCSQLADLAGKIYENGGVIGCVAQGSILLPLVKLPSTGKMLIEGRRVTAMTNKEEYKIALPKYLPHLAQTDLERTGKCEFVSMEPFQSHVVVDGRLVTAQNYESVDEFCNRYLELLQKHCKE